MSGMAAPPAADAKAQHRALASAWLRLRPVVSELPGGVPPRSLDTIAQAKVNNARRQGQTEFPMIPSSTLLEPECTQA